MFNENSKFDWDVRNDAETIMRYKSITRDPNRLRKAQECILDEVNTSLSALGVPTPPPVNGRANRATIMQLKTDY